MALILVPAVLVQRYMIKIVINSMKLKDYLFLSTNITIRLIAIKAEYKQ